MTDQRRTERRSRDCRCGHAEGDHQSNKSPTSPRHGICLITGCDCQQYQEGGRAVSNKTTPAFSVKDLTPFERPGATVEARDEDYFAGCRVTFENGWAVSIQWGIGSYGSNYTKHPGERPEDATEAEIAVFAPRDGMVTWLDGDNVQGYCSMERVQRVLDLVADEKLMREYHPPVELRADDGAHS